MTDDYKAIAILKETQEAVRQADEFISAALATESHPSAAVDMAESCAQLRAKLLDEMAELETAIEIGGREKR